MLSRGCIGAWLKLACLKEKTSFPVQSKVLCFYLKHWTLKPFWELIKNWAENFKNWWFNSYLVFNSYLSDQPLPCDQLVPLFISYLSDQLVSMVTVLRSIGSSSPKCEFRHEHEQIFCLKWLKIREGAFLCLFSVVSPSALGSSDRRPWRPQFSPVRYAKF